MKVREGGREGREVSKEGGRWGREGREGRKRKQGGSKEEVEAGREEEQQNLKEKLTTTALIPRVQAKSEARGPTQSIH